jgi:hypothetical protein
MLTRAETVQTGQSGFDDTAGLITGVTVTAGAVNTKGTYVTLDASAAFDCDGLFVHIWDSSASYRGLVDIALQTSNQDIVIADILVDFNRQDAHAYSEYFPVKIPAGAPIQARLAATTNAVTCEMAVTLVQAGDPTEQGLFGIETIGVDTTDGTGASSGRLECGGSQVDPGGSINTFGAWKELTASTAYPCHAAKLIIGYIQNSNLVASYNWRIQVAVGSAGNEDIVIDSLVTAANATSDYPYPYAWDFPFTAPAGSRVAVRASCLGADATDRLIEAAMYLFS